MPADPATVLTGWGRTAPTAARRQAPATPSEVAALLAGAGGRGVIARGQGRSYGDAAQNAGGVVVSTARLARIHRLDLAAGTVTVDAGVRLGDLMRRVVPRGWIPAVLPGTGQVTVGGAVAADIHGKRHPVDGGFSRHVRAMVLRTPDRRLELDPGSEAFWATAGGMGLTGVVERVTLGLRPLQTAWLRVDTERAADLDDLLARMGASAAGGHYWAAWVDCLAGGGRLGRAVITRADHATLHDLRPAARARPLALPPRPRLKVPPLPLPSGLVRPATVRGLNAARFRRAPRAEHGRPQPLERFLFPLDAVADYNRAYGRRGFVQYQFAVPDGAEATLRTAVLRLAAAGAAPVLAVLKRLGAPARGPLSFPLPGWTLALDLPLGAGGLAAALDGLDELVAAAGGRVYLAKDARLRPELLARMYPRLEEWRAAAARLDPRGVLQSDLSRRLGLR